MPGGGKAALVHEAPVAPKQGLVPPPRGRRPKGKQWDGVVGAWRSVGPVCGKPVTIQEARRHIGRRVVKNFSGHGLFSGKVTNCFYRKDAPCESDASKIRSRFFFRVMYTDGDEEDMLWDALDALSEPIGQDSCAPPTKKAKKLTQAFCARRSNRTTCWMASK